MLKENHYVSPLLELEYRPRCLKAVESVLVMVNEGGHDTIAIKSVQHRPCKWDRFVDV